MEGWLLFVDLTLILLCAGVFYQDLRDRAVSVFLFGGCMLLAGLKYGFAGEGYLPLLFNSLFIITQVLVVMLYCRLRFGTNNLLTYMGAGDLLCWAVLALLFSPLNFIFFFTGSLLASFMLFGILRFSFKGGNLHTVPLAGFQSLLLIPVLACGSLFPAGWQPYNDFQLLTLIGLV